MPGPLIITSINAPTDAVRQFSELPQAWVLVVGDAKSPSEYELPGVEFFPLRDQLKGSYRLATLLKQNHYCRKNLGYIRAIEDSRSEYIAETDDDNSPLYGFPNNVALQAKGEVVSGVPWVNIYQFYTDRNIWPRGLPLNEIRRPSKISKGDVVAECPVQQYLAEGDPDVDAVYRLTVGSVDHKFQSRTIMIDYGSYTTFNSQSTVWFPEAWPLLYLPSHVTFRMTDIWRSLVAQRCLHAMGRRLAYRGPGVHQDRNEHDLMRDFEDEIPGYRLNDRIVSTLTSVTLSANAEDAGENMLRCYERLVAEGIIPNEELPLVEAWNADVMAAMAMRGDAKAP